MIFTSDAGGGQTSVTNALKTYLKNEFEIIVIPAFSELLQTIDPINRLTFGLTNGEALYNFCITKKLNRITYNLVYKKGIWYYQLFHKTIRKLITQKIEHEKPDVIISVIPILNDKILDCAQNKNLPFFLFPPDFDIEMYLTRLNNPTYKKFYLCLPLITDVIQKQLEKHGIQKENIYITGYPLRPSFFEVKNPAALKKEYNLPSDKPIILVMLGALGVDTFPLMAKHLFTIPESVHYIFCTGKSIVIADQIKSLEKPANISFTLIGFTQSIADLMACADIFITKSGSVSVAEGLHMGLPLLLDATSSVLQWEQYNHPLIEQLGAGYSITSYSNLIERLTELLKNKSLIEKLSRNSKAALPQNGALEIKKLIEKILTRND